MTVDKLFKKKSTNDIDIVSQNDVKKTYPLQLILVIVLRMVIRTLGRFSFTG